MSDTYEQLRQRLDDLATGYPATKTGVEIRILKRLFTEKDAELFLGLLPLLETPDDAAARLGRDPVETAEQMEQMAKKGLLFRQVKDDSIRYATIPFVVGLFEFQLNSVDQEMARDFEEYYETAFLRTFQSFKTPVMRTIPINRELVAKWPVAPYEDVLEIIDNQKTIAIAPCICRKTAKLAGKGCDKPLEACFLFGSHGR
ncbi:MAG: 4Fe-4S ferredoxin, partial [Deltaproteobacteria bacterium]|nr:4Fe-4S ferredoxin [Deltaproteobacteria bacterium]